jgi:hypothetical protein
VIEGESGNDGEGEVITSTGRTICWTANTWDLDGDEEVITAEDRANARLIAAAPEMLAALREVADGCARRLRKGQDQGDLDTLRLCRTTIAKAEGVTMYGTNGKERSLD